VAAAGGAAALGYMVAAAAALDTGFFHIFHIISHFNLLFFCIFQIFLIRLTFLHLSEIIILI
jgi:hypothetical protein